MNDASQHVADIQTLLTEAYDLFRSGQFADTTPLFERALGLDYEHAEVISAMKCARFWNERAERLAGISEDFERGEYLFGQWSVFARFIERDRESGERAVYAAKQWVFSEALNCYMRVLETSAGRDPDLLYRIGRCYKRKGNYKQALEYFEASNHQRADDPQIIAELADCYAHINEMRASKVFFREAFFLDPQRIELDSLESTMMHRLIEQVRAAGHDGPAVSEWLPVFGVVYGVFNVKRELRSLEYGKLKQSIYTLESRLAEEGRTDFTLEPRLLNRYFWLIDHYLAAGDDREKIDDVLQKIRQLNTSIYEHYTN